MTTRERTDLIWSLVVIAFVVFILLLPSYVARQ